MLKKTIVLPVMMPLWHHYDVTDYNNFSALSFSEYFKSTREELYSKLSKEQPNDTKPMIKNELNELLSEWEKI